MNYKKIGLEIVRWVFFSAVINSVFFTFMFIFSIAMSDSDIISRDFGVFAFSILVFSFLLCSCVIAGKMINVTKDI